MKINYFITHFPYKDHFNDADYFTRYKRGGAEFAAYHLALEMAKKDEINVFTTSINSKDSFEEYGGVNVHRYGTKFRIEKGNISLGLFTKPLDRDADIVHAHFSTPPGELAGARCAKKKKVPFVLTYHGDWQEGFGGFIRRTALSFYNKYLLDKVLSSADVIISPSEYYIDESRFLGKYRDKIVVIPNGVNIGEFDIGYSKEECREKLGLPIDGEIILFLGALSPHKGPDVLLNAMPKILKSIPDAKLVFVGSGGMKEVLKKSCKWLGIEKKVKIAGFVGDVFKKALFYKSADVFVLPSAGLELFGIVNLEAMACGVPIVASKIGGVPDVVKDGENGLLVPPRDSGALTDAIIYLLENEDTREKMGKIGRRKVEEYSWENIAEETEKVYLSLMG